MADAPDLSKSSDADLQNWIDNYTRRRATDHPFFHAVLEERARRSGKGLSIEVSLKHLMQRAREQRYTTYGDLASVNGVPWEKARHAMNGVNGHLDRLLDVCHARELPLLTALCVNQQGLRSGELGPEALEGFAKGARRLGYPVVEPASFLQECQKASFAWGRAQVS